ncbi:MAG: hypothetical protein F6K19_01780 [Cyanothece sp. SIO1E1]|nr:hypothetical protein [Cyanothece sp. SIO1E1]
MRKYIIYTFLGIKRHSERGRVYYSFGSRLISILYITGILIFFLSLNGCATITPTARRQAANIKKRFPDSRIFWESKNGKFIGIDKDGNVWEYICLGKEIWHWRLPEIK